MLGRNIGRGCSERSSGCDGWPGSGLACCESHPGGVWAGLVQQAEVAHGGYSMLQAQKYTTSLHVQHKGTVDSIHV